MSSSTFISKIKDIIVKPTKEPDSSQQIIQIGTASFFDPSYESIHIDTALEIHEETHATNYGSRFIPTLFNRTLKDTYTIKEVYEIIWEQDPENKNEFICVNRKKL